MHITSFAGCLWLYLFQCGFFFGLSLRSPSLIVRRIALTDRTMTLSRRSSIFHEPLSLSYDLRLWSHPQSSKYPNSIKSNTESKAKSIIKSLIKIAVFLSTYFASSQFIQQAIAALDEVAPTNSLDAIDLNSVLPRITDRCYLDVSIDGDKTQRIEIDLFGDIVPETVQNFKSLCMNDGGVGYKNSDIFRVISPFSIQGGSIITGQKDDVLPSKLGRFGKAAKGEPGFSPENYRILHDYSAAGVVSMMRDATKGNLQDSRFFITLSPKASWADGKYSAFGVVSNAEGMSAVNKIASLDVVPPSNHPTVRVKIVDSGCL